MSSQVDWERLEADWAGARLCFQPTHPHPVPHLPAPLSHILIAILHEKRFLLTRIEGRGWCIPSGHIEPGETPEEAAQREAYEEAGAHIKNLQLMGYYRLLPAGINTAQGESESYALLYRAEPVSIEPLPPGSESQGIAWAELEALPDLYFQWSPLMEAVFHYVFEKANETCEKRTQP